MLERANIQRFPDSEPIARNEIIDVDIRCSQCSREVKGKLNLEIPQAYLDRVREQRFHGEYEGVYADLIQIKTRFEGASVPTHFFDARDGLCVKCGRCANVTYLTEVAVPFNQLCEAITSYFTDDPMIPQAKVIDEKPFCPYCGQKIKVKITLTPTLPKSRAEIVKAYLNWEKRPK